MGQIVLGSGNVHTHRGGVLAGNRKYKIKIEACTFVLCFACILKMFMCLVAAHACLAAVQDGGGETPTKI